MNGAQTVAGIPKEQQEQPSGWIGTIEGFIANHTPNEDGTPLGKALVELLGKKNAEALADRLKQWAADHKSEDPAVDPADGAEQIQQLADALTEPSSTDAGVDAGDGGGPVVAQVPCSLSFVDNSGMAAFYARYDVPGATAASLSGIVASIPQSPGVLGSRRSQPMYQGDGFVTTQCKSGDDVAFAIPAGVALDGGVSSGVAQVPCSLSFVDNSGMAAFYARYDVPGATAASLSGIVASIPQSPGVLGSRRSQPMYQGDGFVTTQCKSGDDVAFAIP